MNIKILKNTQEFNGILLKNNNVLETKYTKSQFSGVQSVKYFLYNLDSNTREEILPKIKKFNIIKIVDASYDSRYIYFTNGIPNEREKIEINIIKYDYLTNEHEIIYSFVDDINILPKEKQIKLFILNDSYLIFQSAYLKSNNSETFEDFLDFELFLLSIKENKEIKIIDENLTNNGIDDIVSISETQSVIKTGYSLLHNYRFNYLEKEEVCVEGICITNIQQLISDLLLVNNNIVIDTIDQAYYNKSFPYVLVKGNYLIYSAFNFETNEEEIFFYNYTTKETRTCINQNVNDIDDLAQPYVIDNNPYIRLNNKKGTEFFNLNRAKIDIKFDQDVCVNDVINNIFIVSRIIKKRFFKKYKNVLSIYKYPQLNLLHQEKASYLGSISKDEDNIYIFVK